MTNPDGYLGFIKKVEDVVEKKEKVSEEELTELRSRIEKGENLSDKELDRCSTELLGLYLKLRGHKLY